MSHINDNVEKICREISDTRKALNLSAEMFNSESNLSPRKAIDKAILETNASSVDRHKIKKHIRDNFHLGSIPQINSPFLDESIDCCLSKVKGDKHLIILYTISTFGLLGKDFVDALMSQIERKFGKDSMDIFNKIFPIGDGLLSLNNDVEITTKILESIIRIPQSNRGILTGLFRKKTVRSEMEKVFNNSIFGLRDRMGDRWLVFIRNNNLDLWLVDGARFVNHTIVMRKTLLKIFSDIESEISKLESFSDGIRLNDNDVRLIKEAIEETKFSLRNLKGNLSKFVSEDDDKDVNYSADVQGAINEMSSAIDTYTGLNKVFSMLIRTCSTDRPEEKEAVSSALEKTTKNLSLTKAAKKEHTDTVDKIKDIYNDTILIRDKLKTLNENILWSTINAGSLSELYRQDWGKDNTATVYKLNDTYRNHSRT